MPRYKPKAAVIVFPGSNGDRDLLETLDRTGFDARAVRSDEALSAGLTGAISVAMSIEYTNATTKFPLRFDADIMGRVLGYKWEFGDGNTSSQQHPSHDYTGDGVYTVRLTVTRPTGSETREKTDYISVSNGIGK